MYGSFATYADKKGTRECYLLVSMKSSFLCLRISVQRTTNSVYLIFNNKIDIPREKQNIKQHCCHSDLGTDHFKCRLYGGVEFWNLKFFSYPYTKLPKYFIPLHFFAKNFIPYITIHTPKKQKYLIHISSLTVRLALSEKFWL